MRRQRPQKWVTEGETILWVVEVQQEVAGGGLEATRGGLQWGRKQGGSAGGRERESGCAHKLQGDTGHSPLRSEGAEGG